MNLRVRELISLNYYARKESWLWTYFIPEEANICRGTSLEKSADTPVLPRTNPLLSPYSKYKLSKACLWNETLGTLGWCCVSSNEPPPLVFIEGKCLGRVDFLQASTLLLGPPSAVWGGNFMVKRSWPPLGCHEEPTLGRWAWGATRVVRPNWGFSRPLVGSPCAVFHPGHCQVGP
jgi:hypothetical protein